MFRSKSQMTFSAVHRVPEIQFMQRILGIFSICNLSVHSRYRSQSYAFRLYLSLVFTPEILFAVRLNEFESKEKCSGHAYDSP